MAPQISIITPVWNGLPYLKECVESVLAQNFQNWEMLISDDGSTDGSREYLNSLTDSRIRLFKQEKNLGIFGNLNFIFKQAKAPISQILCQDDYLIKDDGLSTILDYWRNAKPEVGFVRFNHEEATTSETVMLERKILPSVVSFGEADLWFYIFGNIPGNLSNVSLRTEIVEKCGWFKPDLPYAGDFEFWARAARTVSMGVQKEMVIFVRRHEGVASVFLNRNGELYKQHIVVYEKLIDQLSHTISRKELITHFNLGICSIHYRIGIKAALRGKFAYLITFLKTRSAIDWPKGVQIIACLPAALFEKKRVRPIANMVGKFVNPNIKAI